MIKVWMLVLMTISLSAHAAELGLLKLSPEFEQYLNRPRVKSPLLSKTKSIQALSAPLPTNSTVPNMESRILGLLLGGGINNPIPVDGEGSPLYEEIRRNLEAAHRQIGLEQVQTINRWNTQFNLGTSNFSGFSWQKPIGVVQIYVDRQVTPNLFGSNWLIQDSFNIYIEATTILERLAQEGLSGLSATEIAAFAGMTFHRSYTYYHYANSYQEGLNADFGKLFLSFLKFNERGIETMGDEEILKREDHWTARAGGLITTPPLYNVTLSGGVLAQYDFEQMTSIQNKATKDLESMKYKINILTKKGASAGATLEMQLNFFNLIKFSLLRYDMNYEYASGKEFTLQFNQKQYQQVKTDPEKSKELRSILTGIGSVKKLEPYVVRLDESSSSSIEQRGSFLIFGRMQKSKTESIRVIQDNQVKIFFKNYAQNVRVVQNLVSRIFSAIIYKILKLPIGTSNAAIYSRQITMEYDATHPQASNPKESRLQNTEDFSFVLTQYYNAARTDRWVDRRFKNDIIWFVDNFTTLPKTYKTDIRNELLRGPLQVESHLRVEKDGFEHLLTRSHDSIFNEIVKVCGSDKLIEWTDESSRQKLLKRSQKGPEKCVKDIGKKFLDFKRDYLANYLKPSLKRFKDFISLYYKKADNIAALQVLFGLENTFIHGSLRAKMGQAGAPFNTTFSAGQFRGLGVIDNFKRSNTSRAPASIVSE